MNIKKLPACLAVLAANAGLPAYAEPALQLQASPMLVAQSGGRDSLFEDDAPAAQQTAPQPAPPPSRDSLFEDEPAPNKAGAAAKPPAAATSAWRGYVEEDIARTIAGTNHWSKFLSRADIGTQGKFNDRIKWKIGARLDFDAVYSLYPENYPSDVRKNQRFNFDLRENYLDIDAGDWDFRLGRQHVVWGEVVGLFFADVVSAKDMREFILPDFDALRIPQWAARAEYFKNDFHAELLWIPVPSYNEIGKPGANFYPGLPAPSGVAVQYRDEVTPARNLGNTNYGIRLSTLKNGFDLSGFYYHSRDASPTFYREFTVVPQPTFIYTARHDRIQQYGGTVAKDFGSAVLKAETVYTHGRQYNVTTLTDVDGVVPQNTLDWVASLDYNLLTDTNLNVQLFQRVFFNHNPDIIPDKHENGYSLQLSGKLNSRLEAKTLFISSLNRNDWLLRPSLTWSVQPNLRLRLGLDIFKGKPLGFFGQYNNQDRAYTELRYSF